MQHVIFDAETSYTVGFYTSDKPDNKFHRFSVTVTRPDVHLRYKPGFWNIANRPSSGDIDLKTALESPLDAGAIRIQANARLQTHADLVRLTLFIDPKTLILETGNNGSCRGELDLIVGQKDIVGRVFAIPPYHISDVCDDTVKPNRWLTVFFVVQVRPRSVALRAVVRAEPGLWGSIDIPLGALEE
ncbi:MAG: hypothetical protein M3Y72_10775 [Acidobacteriota bacterium]|nr:hypothetical protein [Acidobacteriota bacterium]